MRLQYTQQNISNDKKLFYAWFEAMHTRIDIAIYIDVIRNDLVEIISQIEAEIKKYEKLGNRFDPQSEISYVNHHAFDNEVSLSDDLFILLTDCYLHNENTRGYFDVSVYSSKKYQNKTKPFSLDSVHKTIRFSHSGVLIDLSGYLKGYVLRKLMSLTDKADLDNFLINLGNSSIYAKGNHPYGEGWKLKIPESDCELILHNECLTTSGNSEKTKWPIINPLEDKLVIVKKPISVITRFPDYGEVLSKVSYLAPKSEIESILKYYGGKIISLE